MSEENAITTKDKKGKRAVSTESTQPIDPEFCKWIERKFRNGESVTSIDAYPLYRGKDREQRKYHRDIKADEKVGADLSVEIGNDIYSDCQLHCDALPRNTLSREGNKLYEVAVISDKRGGLAQPVGTFTLLLYPRIHRPAPEPGDEDTLDADDGDALSARKLMLETFKEISGRDERRLANTGAIVGDTLMLMKGALQDRERLIMDMFGEVRQVLGEFRLMAGQIAERRVEERAVTIDAENAAVDREFRRAQMMKENMWTDVTRAGVIESIKILGQIIPGFGQLAMAMIQGQPPPPPPQLTGPNAGGAALPAPQPQSTDTQLAIVPEEKKLVESFIAAAEQHKIDETHTAAEKLFGKDDDSGKPLEPGVFTREQVAILAGVRSGALSVEALDALDGRSGKPEAVTAAQMAKALAYLTPDMMKDITKFMSLRNEARTKNGAPHAG